MARLKRTCREAVEADVREVKKADREAAVGKAMEYRVAVYGASAVLPRTMTVRRKKAAERNARKNVHQFLDVVNKNLVNKDV